MVNVEGEFKHLLETSANRLQDFAVEYAFYVSINEMRGLPEMDANLKRTVFETCDCHKIDIVRPTVICTVDEKTLRGRLSEQTKSYCCSFINNQGYIAKGEQALL